MSNRDAPAVAFLQWALPHLGLRWPGFRKMRRQVIRRIARRMAALQLQDVDAYRRFLETHDEEWPLLDSFCRITLSRFYRDRRIFDVLCQEGLPQLISQCRARGMRELRCWSAGCGAGEEAYTLALIWALHVGAHALDMVFSVVATDADPAQIARAQRGCYAAGSLKELPPGWRDMAFTKEDGRYCIRAEYRPWVSWVVQDLRKTMPTGPFDLILCRNLAFTYFCADLQRETLQRLGACMTTDGLLVLGAHEALPEDSSGWSLWRPGLPIYRRRN